MASNHVEPGLLDRTSASSELGEQWRLLTRMATAIAVGTSPAAFAWFHVKLGWGIGWSLVVTFFTIIAFRGLVDLMTRRLIPWPSLYGTDDADLKEEDVVNRRRASFWRFWFRVGMFFVWLFTAIWVVRVLAFDGPVNWLTNVGDVLDGVAGVLPLVSGYVVILPFLFLVNFLILFGPLMLIGVTQMRGFEPGDADWGVRLEDVRGQDEAKVEVGRVVSLWQSGEAFEEAGGKRERGLLFLGAPGTGKTMLAKAIATGFNCFAPNEEFLTKDGIRTFAETAGTTQVVLNRSGEWMPAEIRSFGRQPLVEVELRPGVNSRSSVRRTVRATPDHRWVTTN